MGFVHNCIARETAALATEIQTLFNHTIVRKTIPFYVLFCTSFAITCKICRTSATVKSTLTKYIRIHNSHLQIHMYWPACLHTITEKRRKQEGTADLSAVPLGAGLFSFLGQIPHGQADTLALFIHFQHGDLDHITDGNNF